MIGMACICGGAIMVIEVSFIIFGDGSGGTCGEGVEVGFVFGGACVGIAVEMVLVIAVEVVLRVVLGCLVSL